MCRRLGSNLTLPAPADPCHSGLEAPFCGHRLCSQLGVIVGIVPHVDPATIRVSPCWFVAASTPPNFIT
jgi:hypothetical protein